MLDEPLGVREIVQRTFLRGVYSDAIALTQLLTLMSRCNGLALVASVSRRRIHIHFHHRRAHRLLHHCAEIGGIGVLDLADQEGRQNQQIQILGYSAHFSVNHLLSQLQQMSRVKVPQF